MSGTDRAEAATSEYALGRTRSGPSQVVATPMPCAPVSGTDDVRTTGDRVHFDHRAPWFWYLGVVGGSAVLSGYA
eukprot:3067730-Rhodomonas_salina.2